MAIIIKKLRHELNGDYLDFFDKRAFAEGDLNAPCYCTSPTIDKKTKAKMESEFGDDVKGTLRRYAVDMLNEKKIQGYLAYDGELSVGWCNAANMDIYLDFIPDYAREMKCGKTMSVVCFEIAPSYRGQGIAKAFLERVCKDAKARGYRAVEGYPIIEDENKIFDFYGPVGLYQKAGFKEITRQDNRILMRRTL